MGADDWEVCGIQLWILDAAFAFLMLCCADSDRRTRTIPNALIGALLGVSAVHLIVVCCMGGSVAPYLMAIPLFALCCLCWQRGALGGGDVKLLTAICLYLGFWKTAVAFEISIALMTVKYLWIRRGHKRRGRQRIALAPPLAAGCVAALLAGQLLMQF